MPETQTTTTQVDAGAAAAVAAGAAAAAGATGQKATEQTPAATTQATEQKAQEQQKTGDAQKTESVLGALDKTAPTEQSATSTTQTEQKKPDAPAELEIKLPDGAKVEQAQLDAFKTMATELGLDSKQASALLERQLKAAAAQVETDQQELQRSRARDLEGLKGDKKYGGAMYEKTRSAARSILERSEHGKAVSKKLEAYGLDCDPDFTRLLAEFSSLIAEDSTTSRVTNAAPEVEKRPMTQTERVANRYQSKK